MGPGRIALTGRPNGHVKSGRSRRLLIGQLSVRPPSGRQSPRPPNGAIARQVEALNSSAGSDSIYVGFRESSLASGPGRGGGRGVAGPSGRRRWPTSPEPSRPSSRATRVSSCPCSRSSLPNCAGWPLVAWGWRRPAGRFMAPMRRIESRRPRRLAGPRSLHLPPRGGSAAGSGADIRPPGPFGRVTPSKGLPSGGYERKHLLDRTARRPPDPERSPQPVSGSWPITM